MTSAELAVLALVGTGAVASLILYFLWPARALRPPEEAMNDSIVAQQWAGGFDQAGLLPPTHHGGIDAG
jgi:hypothetical protein